MNTRQIAIAALKMEAEACPEAKVVTGTLSMTYKEFREKLEKNEIPDAIETGIVKPFILSLQNDPALRQRVLDHIGGSK